MKEASPFWTRADLSNKVTSDRPPGLQCGKEKKPLPGAKGTCVGSNLPVPCCVTKSTYLPLSESHFPVYTMKLMVWGTPWDGFLFENGRNYNERREQSDVEGIKL